MRIKGVADTFFEATKNWLKVKFCIFFTFDLSPTLSKVKVTEKNKKVNVQSRSITSTEPKKLGLYIFKFEKVLLILRKVVMFSHFY